MPTLTFYDDSGRELSQDTETGYAVHVEFSDWYVRGLLPADGHLVIRRGNGREEQLVWEPQLVAWKLPTKPKEAAKKFRKQVHGTTGLLRFYRSSGIPGSESEELFPGLYISPASLTEDEFRALLERLGELVVLLDSPTVAPVYGFHPDTRGRTEHDESSYNQPAGKELLQRVERFIGLCETIQQYWPLITQRPSCDLRREEVMVPAESPYIAADPSAVISYALHPGRREIKSVVAVESLDVADNRFLAYLLTDVILHRAGPLLRALKQRGLWLSKQPSLSARLDALPPDFRADYGRLWQVTDRRRDEELKRLRRLWKEVQEAERWASLQLQSSFLADCKPELPFQPSQRLLQSPDYGSVYSAFVNYRADASQQSTKGTDLLRAIEERAIHPTWDLYEKWVFVEIYRALVQDFGFRPIRSNLLDELSTENARLSLPEGRKLELVLVLAGEIEARCTVSLSYAPRIQSPPCEAGKNCYNSRICPNLLCYRHIMGNNGRWSRLQPDIWLGIVVDGNRALKFAIDAKTRRYGSQTIEDTFGDKDKVAKKYGVDLDTVFKVDLLGTAKLEYLNGLGLTAAFIIHSDPDPDPQYTFWGGMPYEHLPEQERMKGKASYWPGHRFGAVFASPTRPSNIHRLLKCILMYHCGLYDICWNCRKRMTFENGSARIDWKAKPKRMTEKQAIAELNAKAYRGGVVYYRCPDCGAFWIFQRCLGQGHPLIKLGDESFHAQSRKYPTKPWRNLCPQCGSDYPEGYD
jgi:hypothetical protein